MTADARDRPIWPPEPDQCAVSPLSPADAVAVMPPLAPHLPAHLGGAARCQHLLRPSDPKTRASQGARQCRRAAIRERDFCSSHQMGGPGHPGTGLNHEKEFPNGQRPGILGRSALDLAQLPSGPGIHSPAPAADRMACPSMVAVGGLQSGGRASSGAAVTSPVLRHRGPNGRGLAGAPIPDARPGLRPGSQGLATTPGERGINLCRADAGPEAGDA